MQNKVLQNRLKRLERRVISCANWQSSMTVCWLFLKISLTNSQCYNSHKKAKTHFVFFGQPKRSELAKLPPNAKVIIFVGEDKIPN